MSEGMTVQGTYPQCRIVSIRMMRPETTERILNKLLETDGIRKILLHGQSIPKVVPYGLARGMENRTDYNQDVKVGGTDINLKVLVGDIILELENKEVVDDIQKTCDTFFTEFPFYIQHGTFIKPTPTQTDYAKYGPDADPDIIGMADPKSKTGPVLITGAERTEGQV